MSPEEAIKLSLARQPLMQKYGKHLSEQDKKDLEEYVYSIFQDGWRAAKIIYSGLNKKP